MVQQNINADLQKQNKPAAVAGGKRIRSLYLNAIRNRKAVWAWSIILAIACTFISYPGIWYSDSYVRVTTAEAVANAIGKTLTGRGKPLETGNAFTVIPSFFMAPSYAVTGHFGLYTFFQAFGLFAAVFLLIQEINPPFRRTLAVLFGLSPIVYGASVYYEANVGSLIGLIMLILLFRRAREDKDRVDRAAEFILVALSSLITFGYRTNALTVVPVLVVYLFVSCRKQMVKKALTLGALILGIALTWLIPAVFQVHGESNASTAFVWEILTTIQRMDPDVQAEYLDYMDDLCGEEATRSALETNDENSVDGFMWAPRMSPEVFSAPGAFSKVLGKYFRLIVERPGDWLRVKADFTAKAMGITGPLDLYEYPYNRWERMAEYGFNDSDARKGFHASFLRFNEVFQFITCRPWVAFLVSACMVIAEAIRKNRKTELYALLLWLAIFYYLAYLIMIVVFEQRMFYPSLILLLVCDAAITSEWICGLAARIRKRKRSF